MDRIAPVQGSIQIAAAHFAPLPDAILSRCFSTTYCIRLSTVRVTTGMTWLRSGSSPPRPIEWPPGRRMMMRYPGGS